MNAIRSTLEHRITIPNLSPAGTYPALIMLHGRGANEQDLLGLTPHFDPRLMIIAARAPFSFSYGGYTWYDMLEVGAPEPGQFSESYERLIRFLEDVREHYPVDRNRLFLLGFSMGTVMAYAYALTKPENIRGVAAHSGYIPESTSLVFRWDQLKNTAFFVAHGEHDPVIGVEYARRAKKLLSAAAADLTYKEYPIAHSMSEESVEDVSAWLKHRVGGVD